MGLSAIIVSALTACGLLANERGTLAGKIVDSGGQPIDHATVLVYHAGVKHGYSTFCPSCYADCGKGLSLVPTERSLSRT